MSRRLKRAAHPIVRVAGPPLAAVVRAALRLSARQAGVAVAYHTVAERTGEPATELVPPHGIALFESQIRHLRRHYRVVAAAELPRAVAERRRGQRFPATITFDDDLDSHVSAALPVLLRESVSATFFLSGASLDRPFSFWWERLQRAVDAGTPVPPTTADGVAGPVEATAIRTVGLAVEQLEPAARRDWSDELLQGLGPEPPDAGLRRDGVRTLVQAGMTIGFHTRRHDGLPALGDEELAAALSDGREELEEVARYRLEVVGYPHGRADGRTAAAARAAGFTVGYTTAEKGVTPASDVLLLGRLNPSYRSAGHFAVQLVRALAGAHR